MSNDALAELAERYIWWQSAAETLLRPERLLCQLMQFGTDDDVRTARTLLGDEAFRDALRSAPPGVLDDKSWNFWHLVLFRQPPPPQPSRPLPP